MTVIHENVANIFRLRQAKLIKLMLAHCQHYGEQLTTSNDTDALQALDTEWLNIRKIFGDVQQQPDSKLFDALSDLYLSLRYYMDLKAFNLENQVWGAMLLQMSPYGIPPEESAKTAAVVDDDGSPYIFDEAEIQAASRDRLYELAETYNYHGILLWRVGQFRQSIVFFTEAFGVYERIHHLLGMVGVWVNISNLHYTMGEFQDAVDAAQRAVVFAEQGNDDELKADVWFHLAAFLDTTNQWNQAQMYFEKVIAYYERVQHNKLSLALYAFGQNVQKQNDLVSAIELGKRAVNLMQDKQSKDRVLVEKWLADLMTQAEGDSE